MTAKTATTKPTWEELQVQAEELVAEGIHGSVRSALRALAIRHGLYEDPNYGAPGYYSREKLKTKPVT